MLTHKLSWVTIARSIGKTTLFGLVTKKMRSLSLLQNPVIQLFKFVCGFSWVVEMLIFARQV